MWILVNIHFSLSGSVLSFPFHFSSKTINIELKLEHVLKNMCNGVGRKFVIFALLLKYFFRKKYVTQIIFIFKTYKFVLIKLNINILSYLVHINVPGMNLVNPRYKSVLKQNFYLVCTRNESITFFKH